MKLGKRLKHTELREFILTRCSAVFTENQLVSCCLHTNCSKTMLVIWCSKSITNTASQSICYSVQCNSKS